MVPILIGVVSSLSTDVAKNFIALWWTGVQRRRVLCDHLKEINKECLLLLRASSRRGRSVIAVRLRDIQTQFVDFSWWWHSRITVSLVGYVHETDSLNIVGDRESLLKMVELTGAMKTVLLFRGWFGRQQLDILVEQCRLQIEGKSDDGGCRTLAR